VRDRVEKSIDKITPALGVNVVELVDVKDGIVSVRVFPSICSAGMAPKTILALLEEQLLEDVPEVTQVDLLE